jgi:hypothetical protein
MDLLSHFQSHASDDEEGKILCLLLEGQLSFNKGLDLFSKKVASHIGERDLKRLLKDSFKYLIAADAFRIEEQFLNSKNAFEIIESVVYLEILHEEYLRKSGRRGFFIANFKAINVEWVYLAYQVLVLKTNGVNTADLLSLFIGNGSFDLNIISKWTKEDLIKSYVKLSRKLPVGYFQDGSFIGFKNYKKINDIEDILQLLFDEISLLHDYVVKRQGNYFEEYGLLAGIKELPKPKEQKEKPKAEKAKENQISPVVKNLAILGLKEMPANAKELKKVFFKLAAATHPDKFAHAEKGTRTEIAIVDKFREIYNAYEFIENELEKR